MAPDATRPSLRDQVSALSPPTGKRPRAALKAQQAETPRSQALALKWGFGDRCGARSRTGLARRIPLEQRREMDICRSTDPAEKLLGALRQRTE